MIDLGYMGKDHGRAGKNRVVHKEMQGAGAKCFGSNAAPNLQGCGGDLRKMTRQSDNCSAPPRAACEDTQKLHPDW